MKIVPIIFTLLLAVSPVLRGQEPAATAPTRLQLAPAAAPTPAAEPEVTLIPEQIPQNPKPAAPKAEPKSKTEQNAEEQVERIHFREARIKALRDPKVQAEWDRSLKAKTDFEKREALKSYYKLLHARIVKIDSSVKSLSDTREKQSLRRLEQTRIDPTEPLDPEERGERFERDTDR